MVRVSKSAERMHKDKDAEPHYDWAQAALEMALTETNNIGELVDAAQLNPQEGDLSDIDLSNLDLTDQDMSGWDLRNAKFDNAKLADASLKNAIINPVALARARDWEKAELDPELRENTKLAKLLIKNTKDLKLSVRTANCLINARIIRLGDLVQMQEHELLRLPNFGRKSLKEIHEILGNLSLKTGMKVAWWKKTIVREYSDEEIELYALKLLDLTREMSRHGLSEDDIMSQLQLQVRNNDLPFKIDLKHDRLHITAANKSWEGTLE